MGFGNWMSGKVFRLVHENNLVYNTCWEDPRLDREALQLGPEDRLLVITSAGCNALDYLLDEPAEVVAVDMNPRQNALLELKVAGIRHASHAEFYQMFGEGCHPQVRSLYQRVLRPALSEWTRRYWDRHLDFFERPRRPFYFRGTSGAFARMINAYIDRAIRARSIVNRLLDTRTIDEQRAIYTHELKPRFWTRPMRFMLGRDTTLSLLGVPRAQRQQVERDYAGGIVRFIEDCLDAVFGELPLQDNYFWRVYITGRYDRDCCPEYLKPSNFQRLKEGLLDRLSIQTNSVQGYLDSRHSPITRFVLLDHMDWLSSHRFPLLEAEWQSILRCAAPGARVLWRSGGLRTDFVDRVRVRTAGGLRELGELLHYHRDWAQQLHQRDRVHTYGSFYIADLAA